MTTERARRRWPQNYKEMSEGEKKETEYWGCMQRRGGGWPGEIARIQDAASTGLSKTGGCLVK